MAGLLDYFGDDLTSTSVLVLLAILVRVLTGVSSYSGAGDPPKYGDYEAQRHWMELTINLPVRDWYTDSEFNSPDYWPLDYPPLSGYQSWLCGLYLRFVDPRAVAPMASRGYETPASKAAMRNTVIAADLLGGVWAGQQPGLPQLLAVAKLGVTVLATLALCWAPYLTSLEAAMRVVARIFPVRRGLYEDYVANWWCATSLLLKWKSAFAPGTLLRAAAATTLAAAAPAMAHQIAGRGGEAGGEGEGGPSRWGLLRCMANSAFSFYMFSFQVHEKSILLPLLPVCLLAGHEPLLGAWLPLLAGLSMYPLLERDGLALPYVALCGLYGAVVASTALEHARQLQDERRTAAATSAGSAGGGGRSGRVSPAAALLLRRWPALSLAALVGAAALHAARLALPPPERLPWLHDRAFISAAFGGFAVAYLYLQASQWRAEAGPGVAAGPAGKARGKAD
ncbi:hypothetical protein GPECTOR_23g142 [Gonium pectorale]|uniref:Alpha-1,3-glucosyltransferase n=1 Tax=Gonium pectorale TaxID=33097 RepID=A0A150GGX4_GONPE|nr:hypothetical protein GPECTOR_23g142 [Gonium pectorale]|eukprot:KXZ49057.1 hypothetical protein GPECTOR_23g142 [Gonium pectorale]